MTKKAIKKVTGHPHRNGDTLDTLDLLGGVKGVKKVKGVTGSGTGAVTPLRAAHRLGWTVAQVAAVYGVSARAIGVLAADGNLAAVTAGRYDADPGRLAAALAGSAVRAGGVERLAAFAAWTPAGRVVHDEKEPVPADWPPLVPRLSWRKALGFVPSRRQVIDRQVARWLHELGPDATVQDVADRMAIWVGDRDFLEALFAPLDARVEEVNSA